MIWSLLSIVYVLVPWSSLWNCLPIFFFDNFCAVLISLLSRVLMMIKQVKTFRLMHVFLVKCQCRSVQCCQHLNHSWLKWCEPREYAGGSWCAHCACLSSEQGGVCMRQRSARTLHNTQSWDYYALRARPVRLETSSVMTPMPFNPWYLDISSAHCFASTCDASTYSQCGHQIDFGVETSQLRSKQKTTKSGVTGAGVMWWWRCYQYCD